MYLTAMWKLLPERRVSICSKREQIVKTLLIMKLTTILLLAASLQLSARGITQITLKEKNAPLEKVFQQIKKQSGYVFWYEDKLLEKAKPVNISVKNATLEQLLQLLFQDQPLALSLIHI